uniref:Uncharacterized protein n=1 Tax=Ananas comosus var. bracteatus TaxID=296719 RepID=A0A6V7PL16_ANACO|nr:unnamed protein product [Ananas comosus var. bracteatus]
MSDGSWSVPDDIEVGKGGISKKSIEWFEKKLTEADNLFEKGEALLDKIYEDASNGHTIFKCERKADGREPPEPRAVAIGPYHRDCNNQLKFNDDYKLEITRFMAKYCSLDTKMFLKEMEENEEAVRSCYNKDLSEWSSTEFQMMLLLDSSFILFMMDGFCTRNLEPDYHYVEYMALLLDVREHSEPIKLDLLTVDNQIPFFAIEILLDCFLKTAASLYDYSKPIFRNLIAFEATPTNSVLCFTAYMACMSCILQREDDVKLLRERGIVASTSYKDVDIVKFFEELNKEVEGVEMPDTLSKLYTNVRDHHNSQISKWWGNFMLQYCPNFWVGLSLVTAILIFTLFISSGLIRNALLL